MRPVIVFNTAKIDEDKQSTDDVKRAAARIFLIASEYMFYPGYVENWVVVVDTAEKSFHEVPKSVKYN